MHAKPKRGGFTLVELLIVIVIIALIAAIAVPNLLAARLNANETSAIATIRNVSSAQAQFQSVAAVDVDVDGAGEFGLFRELSGAGGVRTTADAADVGSTLYPSILSGSFQTVTEVDEVSRSGYLFRMVLPGDEGLGVFEDFSDGALAAPVDSNLAETVWGCYAYPARYGGSGARTFFINQSGEITFTEAEAYGGSGAFVTGVGGAAFLPGGSEGAISGSRAIDTEGRDGQVWTAVR